MRVHFLGVRGSTPAPGADFVRYGGHTSCLALAHDDQERPTLLLDAGTGIRRATALLGDAPFAGSVLLSHLHWDHLTGLPFFLGAVRDDATTKVVIPRQHDGTSALEALARGVSPPHFPVRPDALRGTWRFADVAPGEFEIEGFHVRADEIPHTGGRTFAYRVDDGGASVTYMTDHCPTQLGPGPDGWGEYHAAALALAQDTDVLIHDAQLVAEELAAEAWLGHAAIEYAVALGRRAGARSTIGFHHKPERTDDELDAIARRFGDDHRVGLATESTVLKV